MGCAQPICAAAPNLTALTLRSGTMSFGAIDLPELRSFTVLTGGLTSDNITEITAAKWPKLEKLALQLGSASFDCDVTIDDVQKILDGNGVPPTVTHLGLANSEIVDEICARLPAAKILPQLKEIDLSLGTMGIQGAEALAAAKERFAHLELLDVSESWIDQRGRELLKNLCQRVELGGQNDDGGDPDDRYITAGE
jgi:hypothetical protein